MVEGVYKIMNDKFLNLIRDVDQAVRPLVDCIDVQAISNHNALYRHYGADKFKFFIEAEKKRFYKALDIITKDDKKGTVCDLGGFVPWLPIALSKLGYQVKIVDRYEFYGPAFKNAIDKATGQYSIQVFDLDILKDPFDLLGKNDIVMLMAVVEHFNGTPRPLMKKIHDILSPNGFFLFEVPNIAGLIKRIRLLLGHAPMSDYEDYFLSDYPHTGHNREMTVDEVKYMFQHSDFKIEYLDCYDYDPVSVKWKGQLVLALNRLLPSKKTGQSIIAKARPQIHA